MALSDLTLGDFAYFKEYAEGMRNCHDKEFIRYVNPSLIRAMYRGKTDVEDAERDMYSTQNNQYNEEDHLLALVQMFQHANTILPNLYFQEPSPIVIPKRMADPPSAALMSAAMKHYRKENNAKRQNQEAVLNSYFFGLGWKKMGYRAVFAPTEKSPETDLPTSTLQKIASTFTNLIGGNGGYDKSKPDSAESRETPDLAEYETMFNDSESPMNVMTDHKADLVNAKVRLYRLPRTLFDVINYGVYDPAMIKELREKLKVTNGTRFDDRKIELNLNELWVKQRNGLWILSWVDEFSKPLRYDKSGFQGKGFLDSPLVLTNEPGIRYPTSNMKVGSQVQKKLDKLATMYVEIVARSRRLLAINPEMLQPGQEAALESNLIQGIIKVKKGFNQNTDMANITSSPVSNDLPNLMSLLKSTIVEVMGGDPQLLTGQSTNKTLGQDELARSGTKARESGMVDRIRDWEIDQMQKEGTLLKQYSNTELFLEITKSDYQDPNVIPQIQDQWIGFMTQGDEAKGIPPNPLGLKHYLQGEFDYDLNIEEAIKPDKKSQQAQYEKIILTSANPVVQDALLNEGKQIMVGDLYTNYLGTMDGIGNPQRFVKQLDSMQLAALQTKRMLQANPGMMSPKPVPVPPSGKSEEVTSPSSGEANA